MAKNNKLLLYRTNILGSITEKIEHGELALNYNSSSPFIMFKGNNGSIEKLGALSDVSGTSIYHSMTQKAVSEQVTMPSDYNVTYPNVNGVTLINTIGGSHTKTAIENIDSNLSAIAQKLINSENSSNTQTEEMIDSIGLNDDLSYKQDISSNYLSDVNSLSEADSKLDNVLGSVSGDVVTLRNDLTTETNNRISADNVLQDNINTEKEERIQTINNLQTSFEESLNNEVTARQDAINELQNTLQTSLNSEIQRATDAEKTLQDNIILEENARINADNLLQSNLDAEIRQRNEADNALSSRLDEEIAARTNAISKLKLTAVTGTELSGLGTNVKEAYKLIDANSSQHGDYIKIYKDTSLKDVTFSEQQLHFTYILTDGSEDTVDVDVSAFLTENEYGDGLQVIDHVISVKKDTTSESFLTIGENGVKLNGIQTAINTAVAAETSARTSADNTLSDRITTLEIAVGDGGSVETQINNAISELSGVTSGNGSNVDVTVTQAAGKISNVEVSDVVLSDSYIKVEYPEISDSNVVFNSAIANDTLDVVVNKLDQNISTLVQEVLNNEEVIAAALTKHNESAGFDENANYVVDSTSTYISNASTLSEADSLLDSAVVAEVNARTSADNALSDRITTLEIAVGDGGSVETQINNAISELDSIYTQSISVDANGKVTNFHIGFELAQTDGKITSFKIDELDIASEYDLKQEIEARKAIDGQNGQTYSKNIDSIYISNATSLNDADILLNDAINNLNLTTVTGTELSSLGTNVKEAYKLIDANSSQHGDYIKIYKDTSLKDVTFSEQQLHFTYILSDGSEDTVDVDVSAFLTENEYGDGLQVVDHVISVKKDTTSESFLTIGENGIKLNGIQTAINTAVAAETSARTSAVNTLTTNLNNEITRAKAAEEANAAAIAAETSARTSADNTLTTNLNNEISARTSADNALSNRITILETAVGEGGSVETQINDAISELSGVTSGNGTHVDVTVTQAAGKITSVSVLESDIASANALSTETNNRTTNDNKIINAVGLNSDGTFKKPTTAQTSGYTTAASSILDAIIILDNQVEENETVAAYALTDLNDKYLSLESFVSYLSGHTTTTSLSSIPTTKRMCIATISSSQTLGLNGSIIDGREIHIFIRNTNTSDITITIPSSIGSKTVVNMLGENLTIYGSSYAEINIAYDGTNYYYRGV